MNSELFELKILKSSRNRLLKIIKSTAHDALFKIPVGFNNNIIWQIGHCITSQQRHMYMRSGLQIHISNEFMDNFKIGTSPSTWNRIPDVDEVKYLLIYTVDQLYKDLERGIFVNYEPFTLPIGFTVTNHLQALQASNFHEAEHSGIILSYLKILDNKSIQKM